MDSLINFLTHKGMVDADRLESFLTEFVENPKIFFNLNAKERHEFERMLDNALLLLHKL